MTRLFVFPLLVVSLLLASSFAANAAADRVYRNGKVFTAEPDGSIAQAVAIREGRIVYVGSNEGVVPFIGPFTKVTDLGGQFSCLGSWMATCIRSKLG